MISIPKTPKRQPRFQRPEDRDVFRRVATPTYRSHFQNAASTIQNMYSEQISSPPVTVRKFVPHETSTPAIPSTFRYGGPLSPTPHGYQSKNLKEHISLVELESDEEELDLPFAFPSMTSPEPRPASEPLFTAIQSSAPVDPRPSTAEPVESHKISHRSPPRRRIQKLTFAKTPHCARPTKSWLNRLACFKRDD